MSNNPQSNENIFIISVSWLRSQYPYGACYTQPSDADFARCRSAIDKMKLPVSMQSHRQPTTASYQNISISHDSRAVMFMYSHWASNVLVQGIKDKATSKLMAAWQFKGLVLIDVWSEYYCVLEKDQFRMFKINGGNEQVFKAPVRVADGIYGYRRHHCVSREARMYGHYLYYVSEPSSDSDNKSALLKINLKNAMKPKTEIRHTTLVIYNVVTFAADCKNPNFVWSISSDGKLISNTRQISKLVQPKGMKEIINSMDVMGGRLMTASFITIDSPAENTSQSYTLYRLFSTRGKLLDILKTKPNENTDDVNLMRFCRVCKCLIMSATTLRNNLSIMIAHRSKIHAIAMHIVVSNSKLDQILSLAIDQTSSEKAVIVIGGFYER